MNLKKAKVSSDIFKELSRTIQNRNKQLKSGDTGKNTTKNSYTISLLKKGLKSKNGIAAKITEESNELIEAALEYHSHMQSQSNTKQIKGLRDNICHEIGDLLYHVFVLAEFSELSLEDIQDELQRRYGRSGLEEKRMRSLHSSQK